MAGKRVKAKGGLVNKITSAPKRAGAGMATYLLKGMFIDGGKRKGGAKRVKAK